MLPRPVTVAELHADQAEWVVFNPKRDVEPQGQKRKMTLNQQNNKKKPKQTPKQTQKSHP